MHISDCHTVKWLHQSDHNYCISQLPQMVTSIGHGKPTVWNFQSLSETCRGLVVVVKSSFHMRKYQEIFVSITKLKLNKIINHDY